MTKLNKSTVPKGYEDWQIDYDNGLESLDLKDLTLHLESEQKESGLNGEVMAERLKDKSANAAVLWYLLDNPEKIPEEWKEKYVYFWGTILRSPGGNRYVLYLYFSGGEWVWNCSWLGGDWDARDLSAGLASKLALSTEKLNTQSSDALSLELRIEKLEETVEKLTKIINV